MKKILITFAATTALWASVAYGADKLGYVYVLSASTMQSLVEQYEQVYNAVKIPVIGIGGIMNATDAIEFIIAGATAIEVGTALFIDPTIPVQIIEGISQYMERHKMQSVNELIGSLQC